MRHELIRAIFVVAILAANAVTNSARADDVLPEIGGPGGGKFEAHCPPGQLLAGIDLHAADDVDAVRPLCVTPRGPRDTTAPALVWRQRWRSG